MSEHLDPVDPEELLRRALLDPQAAAAVALHITGMALADTLTIIFHGRLDLGTIQTFIANGGQKQGDTVRAGDLLRVPCDLDLHDAHSKDEAEELYTAQAKTLRDALLSADTVLAVWRDALQELEDTPVGVDRSIDLGVVFPAHRLMPIALVAPEKRLAVAPVCSARTLAEGRPPLGIAISQQDVSQVYPLPDDPERCLTDFSERAAQHARRLAEQIEHQEASVRRFLELSGDDAAAA